MKLIIWEDKYGDIIYRADGDYEREALIDILHRRIDGGYLHYPDDAEDRAKFLIDRLDKLDDNSVRDAARFLRERDEHEYEGFVETSTIN